MGRYMRGHLHRKDFIEYLYSFDGLGYYEYPFPVASLFLFGDDNALRFAFFGCALMDGRDLSRNFSARKTASIEEAVVFLDAYFGKKEAELPPLDLSRFTEQQRKVYRALAGTSFGKTMSYKELAVASGVPRAARFVGSCMANNIFPVFIPCHRVLPVSGGIGNYSAGLEIKKFLLQHEGAV